MDDRRTDSLGKPSAARRTHRDRLPKDLCPALSMKQALTHGLDDVVWDDREHPGDGYFWCRHTCTQVGRDGGIADVDTCRPGRACYEGLEL